MLSMKLLSVSTVLFSLIVSCDTKDKNKNDDSSINHLECSSDAKATSNECAALAARWCANSGYDVGFIQQLATTDIGLGCYHGLNEVVPYQFTVQRSWGSLNVDIMLPGKANLYCKEIRGMDIGIIHEWSEDSVALTCLNEDGHAFVSKDETSCKPGKQDEAKMSCRADGANACIRAGFDTGIVTETAPWGMEVSCFRTGTYMLAPISLK